MTDYEALFINTLAGRKAVVVFSGGMDSTALLAAAAAYCTKVLAVSFNYNQRHARELLSASAITAKMNLDHIVVNAAPVFSAAAMSSALTNMAKPVPDGLYDESNMAVTVVPGRNLIFLSIAASIAEAHNYDLVLTGVHAGDHMVYSDCRPEFIRHASFAINASTDAKVTVMAPFMNVDKAQIAKIGFAYTAPFNLSWSCYKGGTIQCGECGTCTERIEAFYRAGVTDPTHYPEAAYLRTLAKLREAGKIS